MKRYTHPKQVFVAGLAVAVILCIGKTVQTVTGIHRAATDYAPEQTVSADGPLEIVNTETFRDHTTLVVTAIVRTRDPDTAVYGAQLCCRWTEDDMDMEEWTDIPVMPYGTETWSVSAILRDMTPEEAESLEVLLDTEYQWEDSLEEYDWLTDPDDPDSQDLLTAWQKKIYSRECVRLDGYDQEQVTYTVLPDSRSGDSMYGSVLIQFMDGDRCVFAMTDVYDSGDREMTSLEKTCMIPCDIPAWTSVTVTRLL
ncbi:hypothetical protein [uncultured Faecalibaculum sp.]|uniref:hypothetical protein n=1 Tax=uncultured Faecalibaculum sp. TaxID=1729681 RepID=UPI0025F76B5B|nr:hypothetical protein [uncultured Faecalibaculum sp.]